MAGKPTAAEITPTEGKARQAALKLQHLGFRVLHVGPTISVEASEDVWRRVFAVSFRSESRSQSVDGLERTVEYRRPEQDAVGVPAHLDELIADIAFVQPPDFF